MKRNTFAPMLFQRKYDTGNCFRWKQWELMRTNWNLERPE